MDMKDLVNQVLQEQEDIEQKKLQSFVEKVVQESIVAVKGLLVVDANLADPQIRHYLEKWTQNHAYDIGWKVGGCVRILLTQELLGDQEKGIPNE